MSVVTVPAARTHLLLEGTVPPDATVQGFIDSAEAAIAALVGPLEPAPITERLRPSGSSTLILTRPPAISITSVTGISGGTVDPVGLFLDGEAGVVTSESAVFTDRYYDVVYQAGWDPCPADLVMAVKELMRDQWQASQRGDRGPGPRSPDKAASTVVGAEKVLPFQVSRLIAPYLQSGFA